MSNPKNNPFDNLQSEIAKEKFSALRRISENLSACLNALEALSVKIDEAMRDNLSVQEINKMIATFNSIREDAEEWRHYLIVTRESSGLFHSNLKAGVYKIPLRKKPIPKSV
ncbi:MAG: hypothetical protein WC373_01480 [Smithella sp.]|jgi:hypothetical protein